MLTSLAIDTFQPLTWINEYTCAKTPINTEAFEPILQFCLMWNLFERDACKKSANYTTIGNAVLHAFAKEKLSLSSFQEHLAYFRNRSQREGMTIDQYLHALKMNDVNAKYLVTGVLSSSLTDPNNVVYALLLITHRIRNNLFHGEKEIALLHSQVGLFRTVNSLLATYLSVTKE